MLAFEPLTEAEIAQFDSDGYFVVRNALNAEAVDQLIAAGDRLIASDLQESRQMTENGRYDGFRNAVTLDDAFVSLIDHERVLPIVVQLLGANLHLVTSHLIYKKPDPADTPDTFRQPGWHRDYAQAMHDMGHVAIPRLLVKCAYYLTDLSEAQRGATMVAPGSNLLCGKPDVPEGQVDPMGAVEPSLQPGDCLIFENRTFHAGAIHRGASERKAIMMGYGYRWVMPMDYVKQEDEFMAKLNPLQRYLAGGRADDVKNFQPGGGRNPLAEWCEEHGLPTARYPRVQALA